MKVLFTCTGNSCRSPMAEGLFKKMFSGHEAFSAGVMPEKSVSKWAVLALEEEGVDISGHMPRRIEHFMGKEFDKVICFSRRAYEFCYIFFKESDVSLIEVPDPMGITGSDDIKLDLYRQTREILKEIIGSINPQ
jgi:protein-tyrosine-phosphatase